MRKLKADLDRLKATLEEENPSGAEALRFAVAAGSAAAFCGWLPDRAAVEAVLRRTAAPTEIR